VLTKFISSITLVCVVLVAQKQVLLAQAMPKDSIRGLSLIVTSYSLQHPSGDMALRFGWSSALGGQYLYKNRNNYILGIAGYFIFGNDVHEPGILANIATPEGYFIGADGQYAEVRFYERGFSTQVTFGKIFPLNTQNKNSGLLLMLGPGFLQHKIRIEDPNHMLPSLTEPYLKGYDRLTNGFSLNTFIGYLYLSKNHMINFYIGLDLTQALTENRRSFNLETGLHDSKKRHDYLNGIRIGWLLPLYKRASNQFYYN
jgi:hypothetical protein